MSKIDPIAVLLVEDKALIRMDLADQLQAAGYQTHEAANSADAIAILELYPEIRAVFTDVQMPGDMDGLQLSHYVRKRWPPTVIVVCSTNVLPSPDVLPSEATFVAKPYETSAIQTMLAHVGAQLAARSL